LNSESSSKDSARGDIFVTTHWTAVLFAGRRHSPECDRALEELCRTYWYPLYAYVRRRGYSKEDAEDLVQAFFAKFLAKNYLEELSAERGRFRAFLLAALKHFLVNEWRYLNRQKRGGGETMLSLDWATADTKFQVASVAEPAPDKAFDREWAVALLENVIRSLQAEWWAEGKGRLFEQLKVFLVSGTGETAHAEVARLSGMDEGAVRVAVHRLRKRYRALLRDEIANTLSNPALVDEEMRALFGAFG
jgi:RNA polymerase sigma factor (sigma-70 family)